MGRKKKDCFLSRERIESENPALNEKTEKSRESCGISKYEALLASKLIQGSANSRGYLLQPFSEASDRLPFLLPSQVLSSGF